ncbi:MAG: hypothetical protein R3B67_12505 [Phycisphaerales bacterium]
MSLLQLVFIDQRSSGRRVMLGGATLRGEKRQDKVHTNEGSIGVKKQMIAVG